MISQESTTKDVKLVGDGVSVDFIFFFYCSTIVLEQGVIIIIKEISLKIGFIEKHRTCWGYKEVPQIFFHYFLYIFAKIGFNLLDSEPLATLH